VSPGEFIAVLKETRLIIDIGRWAMEKAVAEYSQWLAINPRPPRIAVNEQPSAAGRTEFRDWSERFSLKPTDPGVRAGKGGSVSA
jgi:EAL domain-containing protein (putative c-di-GMP-specific phosphodiesterase class I)